MDPASLRDTIGGTHDLPVEWCVDLGSPGVAVTGPYADEESAEKPGGGVPETGPSRVDFEQVVGEPLTEHVGAVARDAVAWRVDGHPPFAPQREVDDDGAVEFIRHGLMLVSRLLMWHDTGAAAEAKESNNLQSFQPLPSR
jgi:hypothetical protein